MKELLKCSLVAPNGNSLKLKSLLEKTVVSNNINVIDTTNLNNLSELHIESDVLFIDYHTLVKNIILLSTIIKNTEFLVLMSNEYKDAIYDFNHRAFDFINDQTLTSEELLKILFRIRTAMLQSDYKKKIEEVCAGTSVLTDVITPTPPLIIASQDDNLTTDFDGFIEGNEIIYKFWNNSTSLELITILATYDTTPPFSNVYTSLGAALVELVGFSCINTSIVSDSGCSGDFIIPVIVSNAQNIQEFNLELATRDSIETIGNNEFPFMEIVTRLQTCNDT